MTENSSERVVNLGPRLRFAREAKGLRQQDWSEHIGFSQASISEVELGRSFPTEEFVRKIIATIDPLPCKKNECEGRVDCDNCRVATLIEGLVFPKGRRRVDIAGQKKQLSSAFDLDINNLMKQLRFSPNQQEEAIKRITESALQICLEIAKRPEANP